jgi:SAM-dependent methyltransferase
MDVAEKDQVTPSEALNHWYYNAKCTLIQKHIQSLSLDPFRMSTADVGCGLGLFLHKLQVLGYTSPERSIGVDPAYPNPSFALGTSIPILPNFPKDRMFDFIMLMDVLEHVKNDSEVLQSATRHVAPGGYIFITVPAMPVLFSSHDRFLGHYRRYTINSLRLLLNEIPGLSLLRSHYYFACVLPLAIPMRLLDWRGKTRASSDMKPLPRFLNLILWSICRLELQICKANTYAGLTVVAVCSVNK